MRILGGESLSELASTCDARGFVKRMTTGDARSGVGRFLFALVRELRSLGAWSLVCEAVAFRSVP